MKESDCLIFRLPIEKTASSRKRRGRQILVGPDANWWKSLRTKMRAYSRSQHLFPDEMHYRDVDFAVDKWVKLFLGATAICTCTCRALHCLNSRWSRNSSPVGSSSLRKVFVVRVISIGICRIFFKSRYRINIFNIKKNITQIFNHLIFKFYYINKYYIIIILLLTSKNNTRIKLNIVNKKIKINLFNRKKEKRKRGGKKIMQCRDIIVIKRHARDIIRIMLSYYIL